MKDNKTNLKICLSLSQPPTRQGGSQQFGSQQFGGDFMRSRSNYGSQQSGSGDQSYAHKGSGQKMNKNRGSNTRASQDSRQQVVVQLEREPPIRNRAENPYIPEKLKPKTAAETNELEDLLREVRNILNKLTPQNIHKLTGDLIALPINNEERLNSAIDIIFEKSIDEQVFSQTYAQLCKVLAQIKVSSAAEANKNVSFRAQLLKKCQKEFDTDFYSEINYEKLMAEVEQCTDEQKKAELKEIAEDKLRKAKRRSLGNIRFIGELFKLSMLTEGIMNDCIERLLKLDSKTNEADEENLECLCKLLTTIGKEVNCGFYLGIQIKKIIRFSFKKPLDG
jgi:translation initiation factor 4G